MLRNFVTVSMIGVLLVFYGVPRTMATVQVSGPDESTSRIASRVLELGEGIEVIVRLLKGGTRRGVVREITDDSFRLASGGEPNVSELVTYRRISEIDLVRLDRYVAGARHDSARVRQVALSIGEGRAARIRLVGQKKNTVRISTIGKDSVSVLVDKSGNPSLVPYSDIVEIEKKKMSKWVVVPVVTVVALLAVIVIFSAINPPPT